eukprot:Gb_28989 [translate_table: standard]
MLPTLLSTKRFIEEDLANLFGGGEQLQWKLSHPDSPFHFIWLPSKQIATNIANRSILLKCMFELWGQGNSYEDLKRAVKNFPKEQKLPYLGEESTFRIVVDNFGKVLSFEEQNECIKSFSYISFKGRVDLQNVDHKFWMIDAMDFHQ